jgi:hypothetical protein
MLNKCTVIPSAYRRETDMLFKMQEDLLLKPHKEAVGQAATRELAAAALHELQGRLQARV